MKKQIIFRMDDIGASSKRFEVYSKFFLGNFLFLKYLPVFAAWGPYPELTAEVWREILNILEKTNSQMTIAVTSAWVEEDANLTPFPKKFPKQAKILKRGVSQKLIEIANHGLAHCVVGKHLPRLFLPNRKFHREFWNWVPKEVHYQNLERSQKILQDYFGKVVTFVPPGNVWTKDTEMAAVKFGIKYLCGLENFVKTAQKSNGLIYISDSDSFTFHDRDVVKNGIGWFKEKILEFKDKDFEITTVGNFAQNLE